MSTLARVSAIPENTPRLVRILARKFAGTKFTEDDLIQEGLLAYIKAEGTYKSDQGTPFEAYATRVIKNRYIDILRKRTDTPTGFHEDQIQSQYSMDDAVNLIEIKKALSLVPPLERAIFNSYIEGFSYEEMGKIFTLPRKKIDNTVQKVKKLIKASI